jgi:outer membrane murein-binding lipoprotein Lpp
MSKKKSASNKQPTVKVGNISGISGNVNVAGGNITTHQTTSGLSAADIKQLFDQLYSAIETRAATSPADKEDLKAEMQEVQATVTEAAKGGQTVDESSLSRHFRNIARMAPDILEVVTKTLISPSLGISEVVKKIAEKAKEETGKA